MLLKVVGRVTHMAVAGTVVAYMAAVGTVVRTAAACRVVHNSIWLWRMTCRRTTCLVGVWLLRRQWHINANNETKTGDRSLTHHC